MLKCGNCLIFRKCKDLRDMMEDMDRYQGEKINRDWFDYCEGIINEQGVVYVMVHDCGFVRSRQKPFLYEESFIEVKPRKNNTRW